MSEPQNTTPVSRFAALVEQHRRELSARLGTDQPLGQFARRRLPPVLSTTVHRVVPPPVNFLSVRRSPALAICAFALVVALVGACFVGGLGLAAEGFSLQGALTDPATAAQDYFAALHEQDYTQAYAQLSPAAQARISRPSFTAECSALDGVAGVVESYSVESAETDGNIATVVAQIVRREDPTRAQTQRLTLVKSNGSWRIDAIAAGQFVPAP